VESSVESRILVRDQEVGGSNPLAPTTLFQSFTSQFNFLGASLETKVEATGFKIASIWFATSFFDGWNYVAVDVQGGGEIGVPKQFHDSLRVDALHKQQGSGRVSEIVESKVQQQTPYGFWPSDRIRKRFEASKV